MKEVEIVHVIEAQPEEVFEKLTPENIIEYEGTYSIESVEETESGTVVTASEENLEITVEFYGREDGYRYEQRDGPFTKMETTIRVEETSLSDVHGTEVRVQSQFSFGSFWSFITDRFGAVAREKELRRFVLHLETAIEEKNEGE